MAPHHPHDAENDRQDRLPGREHHRQRDEKQRPQIIARAQQFVGSDPDAVEESGDRLPDEQPDRDRVVAVMQQRRWDHGDRRRVVVRPVGGGIAPAVEDCDAVDGDLDAAGEARQEHRPGAPGLIGRADESTAEARRIAHCIPQVREIRQRHRALGTGLGEVERRELIWRGRTAERRHERQDAEAGNHRLQQQILDEARPPQPPPSADRQSFRHHVLAAVVHNRIRPCWTASNTASPRVCTSSLR